ncbi:MAG: preprotein translocase subunit SecE [Chloroflexi bacterium]|nr:preprotein translocase subunit SecE [Chloroflexota bacterium]
MAKAARSEPSRTAQRLPAQRVPAQPRVAPGQTKSTAAKSRFSQLSSMGRQSLQQAPSLTFFRESFSELRKVRWPTRDETIRLTITVIIVSISTALILGGFDLIFSELIGIIVGAR